MYVKPTSYLSLSVLLLILVCQTAFSQPAGAVRAVSGQAALRKAIEANPANLKLHEQYIREVNEDIRKFKRGTDTALLLQYDKWMLRFPKEKAIPYALGTFLYQGEDPRAKKYFQKVVALDSLAGEVWNMLAIDAMRWGDITMERNYLEKASRADPSNPDYAFNYAYSWQNTNKKWADSLYIETASRYPGNICAGAALALLAQNTSSDEERRAVYEVSLEKFNTYNATHAGDRTANPYAGVVEDYYQYMIKSDPSKAYQIALMARLDVKQNRHRWKHKLDVAGSFIEATKLLDQDRPKEALNLLNSVELRSRYFDSFIEATESLALLKSRAADESGLTRAAFDSLKSAYYKYPTDKIWNALCAYGKKIGIDTGRVKKEFSVFLDSLARPATLFTLERYGTNEKLNLADLKGKVVLLTYWFPGCGPCRREFPHLENVLRKFKQDEVVYLGVNGFREQDDYVLPFLKNKGYSFIPLKDDRGRDHGNLPSISFPTNYLIDRAGKVVYSNFYIEQDDERSLELMVASLLEKE